MSWFCPVKLWSTPKTRTWTRRQTNELHAFNHTSFNAVYTALASLFCMLVTWYTIFSFVQQFTTMHAKVLHSFTFNIVQNKVYKNKYLTFEQFYSIFTVTQVLLHILWTRDARGCIVVDTYTWQMDDVQVTLLRLVTISMTLSNSQIVHTSELFNIIHMTWYSMLLVLQLFYQSKRMAQCRWGLQHSIVWNKHFHTLELTRVHKYKCECELS